MSDPHHHDDEYDDAMVAMLELIWGDGFLSPGGPDAIHEIVRGLDLHDKALLDVGCGIGGIDIMLAEEYGCHITAFDVEAPLIERAKARAERAGLADRIDFRLIEPGPLPFDDDSFDVVFGKDCWIHIEDKRGIFADVFRVLKPGGVLTGGDWLRGPEPYSDDMAYFFKLEELTYHMDTLENYGAILRECGFEKVALVDIARTYRAQAHREYERMLGPLKARMIDVLGAEKQAHFVESWRMLTVVLDKGELRPGRLRARKPD